MRAEARDAAYSDTLGVVIMVAVTAAMAGGLYLWSFGAGLPGEPPAALTLEAAADEPDGAGVLPFAVTSVSRDLAWGDLSLQLDGKELTYDGALGAPRRWCVATAGACVSTATFEGALLPLAEGHEIRVMDADFAGKAFEVRERATGETLARVVLGSGIR